MKKILTNNISENVRRQPFTKVSYDHIQQAFQEVFADIMKGLTENASGVTILHGCIDGNAGATTWDISAGAALYDGEVYQIDGSGVLTHVSQVPVLSLEVTNAAGDPVTFSDLSTHNVHVIRKLKWALGVSGSGISDFSAVKRFKDTIKPNNVATIYRDASGVESKKILIPKVIEIGAWDMDTISQIGIPHGISDPSKIRGYECIIQNDSGGGSKRYVNLSRGDQTDPEKIAGSVLGVFFPVDSTEVQLLRLADGFFDSTDYNDTGINRGWLTIWYEE